MKRSLLGLPFEENSTGEIEVDPSICQVDADEVMNWRPIDKSEGGLFSGCSKALAQMVVQMLEKEEKGAEKHDSDQLANGDNKNGKKAADIDGAKSNDSVLNQVCLQLNPIIIHSKYFSDSDWLKAHA